jgi:hypothetical protein
VKQSLSRVHILPKRRFSLLQQRRKTEGVEKICQYNSDGIQASVIVTKKGKTTRQSRNLISSSCTQTGKISPGWICTVNSTLATGLF